MLKIEGVVTYSGTKISEKTGEPYGMVSLEGLFCFADADALPERGQSIVGVVQANTTGEGAARRTSFNLFSWRMADHGNGNGNH